MNTVSTARRDLGLTHVELATVCGLAPWQVIFADVGVILTRSQDTVRTLLNAFRSGFRPANWPA